TDGEHSPDELHKDDRNRMARPTDLQLVFHVRNPAAARLRRESKDKPRRQSYGDRDTADDDERPGCAPSVGVRDELAPPSVRAAQEKSKRSTDEACPGANHNRQQRQREHTTRGLCLIDQQPVVVRSYFFLSRGRIKMKLRRAIQCSAPSGRTT